MIYTANIGTSCDMDRNESYTPRGEFWSWSIDARKLEMVQNGRHRGSVMYGQTRCIAASVYLGQNNLSPIKAAAMCDDVLAFFRDMDPHIESEEAQSRLFVLQQALIDGHPVTIRSTPKKQALKRVKDEATGALVDVYIRPMAVRLMDNHGDPAGDDLVMQYKTIESYGSGLSGTSLWADLDVKNGDALYVHELRVWPDPKRRF